MVPGEVNLIVLQFYLFLTCWEIRTRPGRGGREGGGGIDHGREGWRETCLNGKGEHLLEMFH